MPPVRKLRFVALACTIATPAGAGSGWIGLYRHDVRLAQTRYEGGQDLKIGYMGERIGALWQIGSPGWHVIASKALSARTDYLAGGLDWRFGGRLYVRPGIGMAVQDGPARAYRSGRRVDLGSPVLFEPELAFGWRVAPRLALEASWIHLSHATLFSRQNRGLDSWGVRLVAGQR